jgi:hypothetical protein
MRLLEVFPKGVGSGCLTTGWTSRSLSSSLSPARETRSRESWSLRVRVCTFYAGACVCARAHLPCVRVRVCACLCTRAAQCAAPSRSSAPSELAALAVVPLLLLLGAVWSCGSVSQTQLYELYRCGVTFLEGSLAHIPARLRFCRAPANSSATTPPDSSFSKSASPSAPPSSAPTRKASIAPVSRNSGT